MPKVPVLTESQRLRPSNPTGFQSPSAARLRGESISQFGRGLASFGGALESLDRKQRDAEERLASAEYKAELTSRLQDLNSEVSARPASQADGDKDFYDQRSSEIHAETLNAFSEKYEGKYTKSFDIVGKTLITGVRGGVIANSSKRKQEGLKKGVRDYSANVNAAIFQSPESLREAKIDYSVTVPGMATDMGATDDQVDSMIKDGNRSLSDSAIQGALQQGKFDLAKDIVLSQSSNLYDTAQQKQRMNEIQTAEYRFKSEKFREEQRQSARQKDLKTKEQDANYMRILGAFSQADTPLKKSIASAELQKAAKDGDIAASQFGSLLSQDSNAEKEISAVSAVRIADQFYSADTPQKLDGIKNRVLRMTRTGKMRPEKAEVWLQRIRQRKASGKTDPRRQALIDVYKTRLKGLTGTKETIAAAIMTKVDEAAAAKKSQRKARSESLYMDLTEVQSMDPAQAFVTVKNLYFRGTEGFELFPGYSTIPQDKEDLKEFTDWAKRTLRTPGEIGAAQTYIEEISGEINLIHEFDKLADLEKQLKANNRAQVAIKESQQFIDEIFGPAEEMMKSDGGQLSPLLRDYSDGSLLLRR